VRVERADRLSAEQIGEVLALAGAAAQADAGYPLSEQALLRLRQDGGPAWVHLLARDDAGRLLGYAHVDTADQVAELVVHPDARRRGVGRALLTTANPQRVWAHGDHPGAAALARSLGFVRARLLYQLRRPLTTPLPEPRWPPGVRIRTFRPGADDAAWLAVNARAFAGHPEQGRWTVADLRVRMAEPWFDPDGFLLAEGEGDRLLGFHWTKDHGNGLGEVYVLGVDPEAHGQGLGTALTLAGLRYLQGRGLDQAMLYVEESNPTAVRLYTKLGFTRWSTDVMYVRGQIS
jgi:mycothiol synthase